VQSEKVINPPFTISDSVGVNSRAPRRINTLFWLFIFPPFINWVGVWAQSSSKGFARLPNEWSRSPGLKKWWRRKGRHRCSAMRPAFANLGISVFVGTGFSGDGAQRCGTYSPADARDFLCTQ
jgi:hypothetical protein